jgi:hydroxypyruvate isomerase
MTRSNRRSILKKIAGSTALLAFPASVTTASPSKPVLKGNINHSVCHWCYGKTSLETLIVEAKKIGLKSIELVKEDQWPLLKQNGLTCAMPSGKGLAGSLDKGLNDPANHEEIIRIFEEMIPKVNAAGYDKLICFSGNRRGMSDMDGLRNCATALRKLMPTAEKYGVTLVMELLNSKVDHKDYMCDRTQWGAALCDMVGSERFKLLYDIYHMQIMEGDVIATIKKYHKYIAHYHTGGVPGRHEIDDTQELNYPAIMRAILETGYKGFVGQEFIPSRNDDMASLKQGVLICDV